MELFQESLERPGTPATSGAAEALDKELAGCRFCDPRLGRRFQKLVGQLATRLGQTIPLACQDWTNTKAAYRFLSNGRVNELAILAGHFQATRERFGATDGPILVLHDTTEFSYTRESKEAIGILYKSCGRKDKEGRPRLHTLCGILMHSSLAVTVEGLPLGLAAIKFWTRSKFKGTNALKRKVNPTRVPIEAKESVRWLENLRQSTDLLGEPARCIHIGDRESDIYELFCAAQQSGTKFLVRTCVDRLAGDGQHTIAGLMRRIKVKTTHQVEVRDAKGTVAQAAVKVKYQRLRVYPPIGKQKEYPPLMLTVIYAQEGSTPRGRDRIDWKLITNLPVHSRKDAVEHARLVRDAVAHRNVSQDPEIRMPGRSLEAANGGEDRQPDRCLLYSQLENLLDDNDESRGAGLIAAGCVHQSRDAVARSPHSKPHRQSASNCRPLPISHQSCAAGRLFGAAKRFSTREHGDVARLVTSHRY